MIKTRSGHTIKIDDTENKGKIEIVDQSKKNKISIDSSTKKISIECEGDIELSASKGKVSIKAKEIEIKASTSAKIEASTKMDLTASGTMKSRAQWSTSTERKLIHPGFNLMNLNQRNPLNLTIKPHRTLIKNPNLTDQCRS